MNQLNTSKHCLFFCCCKLGNKKSSRNRNTVMILAALLHAVFVCFSIHIPLSSLHTKAFR